MYTRLLFYTMPLNDIAADSALVYISCAERQTMPVNSKQP